MLRRLIACSFAAIASALLHANSDGTAAGSTKVSVRIFIEPGCPYCQQYITGPLKAALEDNATRQAMNLEVSPFGNAYYDISECKEAQSVGDSSGCGGSAEYDADARNCFNAKCGQGTQSKPKDCFHGELVYQHGLLEAYASRYMVCAKTLAARPSQGDGVPDYVRFFICMEDNMEDAHDGASTQQLAQKCGEEIGLNADALDVCYQSERVYKAYEAEARATPEHDGVPWIIVNGQVQPEDYKNDVLIKAVKQASGTATGPSTLLLARPAHGSGAASARPHSVARNITC